MTLAEQALYLIDLGPLVKKRKNLEFFPSLDAMISGSFTVTAPLVNAPAEQAAAPASSTNSFSIASRLGRSNYDDQARAEALINAIKKIRASHAAKKTDSRFIRGT